MCLSRRFHWHHCQTIARSSCWPLQTSWRKWPRIGRSLTFMLQQNCGCLCKAVPWCRAQMGFWRPQQQKEQSPFLFLILCLDHWIFTWPLCQNVVVWVWRVICQSYWEWVKAKDNVLYPELPEICWRMMVKWSWSLVVKMLTIQGGLCDESLKKCKQIQLYV